MTDSLLNPHTLDTLVAIAEGAPNGNFAEFGVYKGGSAARLAVVARAQSRVLYLFDTFTGIPFKGPIDGHNVGDFNDTSVDLVRAAIPDAVIVEGIFPDSLFRMKDPPHRLAFVHVDADQYESVRAAIEQFPRYMVQGGIMVFDDYNCLDGATKAIQDWGARLEITAQGKALWRKP